MKKVITVFALLLICQTLFGQANFQNTFYSRDGHFYGGYLTTTLKYPDKNFQIGENPTSGGFILGTAYHLTTIEEIQTSKVGNFSLNIGSEFGVGVTFGDDKLKYANLQSYGIKPDSAYNVKHYTVVGDLFSMNINAEYSVFLPTDRYLTAGLAVTLLNIGGTFSYMEGGVFDKKVFGVLNFIPFYIQPYGILKLKGASIGLGILINPYSFLEAKIGPTVTLKDPVTGKDKELKFFGDDGGLNVNKTQISKYAIKVFLRF